MNQVTEGHKENRKKRSESASKENFIASLSGHDKVFIATLSLSIPWGIYFLYHINQQLVKRALAYPDLILAKTSDFFESAIYIVIFVALRLTLADKVFSVIGDWALPKDKWDPETRFHKVDRFGVVLFKFFFFMFISIYGYFLLVEKEWFPSILGGKGDILNCFKSLGMLELDEGVKTYYLIQLGYHAHSFLFQFRMTHRADFFEMVLHHVVTLFLISFSYLTNFTRLGSLVLITHDFSDMFGYAIKSVVDTKSAALTLTVYAGLLLSWAFMRLFVFPFYIISVTITQTEVDGYALFNGMLITLLCLHIYWYTLFLKMGYTFLTRGTREDIIDKVKSPEKQHAE